MMGNGFGIGGFGMMGGGSLMMVILLVLIGLLFYLALNKSTPVQKDANIPVQQAIHSEALNIAKMRLANGEITIEEFDQIKNNLL
jgi:putative membrane protein